jgi:8-oxo-dGTP pyrophosphatase MutT (NUDIX family)
LQKRTHPKGKWGFPGGLMELGESTVETAKREVLEETNLVVDDLKLIGVYSGKDYICKALNGDEWFVVVVAYTTENYSGELRVNDDESESLEWFSVDEIPDNIANTHRELLNDYIELIKSKKNG